MKYVVHSIHFICSILRRCVLSELNKRMNRSEHQIIRVDLEHVHNSKMIIINDTQKSLWEKNSFHVFILRVKFLLFYVFLFLLLNFCFWVQSNFAICIFFVSFRKRNEMKLKEKSVIRLFIYWTIALQIGEIGDLWE